MRDKKCHICEIIRLIKKKRHPHFVAELGTGYVVLADHQFYKGYALFLSKKHVNELHELDRELRLAFLEEMSHVAEGSIPSIQDPKAQL